MKAVAMLILTIGLLAGGCATNNSGSGQSGQKGKEAKDPEAGMTKEQVIALYGKTDNISVSNQGETWFYHLNMGEAFIPFNFGYRPKTRVIMFDKEGKVTSWNYSK